MDSDERKAYAKMVSAIETLNKAVQSMNRTLEVQNKIIASAMKEFNSKFPMKIKTGDKEGEN